MSFSLWLPPWDYPVRFPDKVGNSTMASGPGPEATKHPQTMMLPPHYFTVEMILCWYAVLFKSYIALHVLPKQFYFCFICPQGIFPVVLWSVKVVFGKLYACCNVLFGEQRLPSWCPSMDTMPVQCLKYGWLMNGDVNKLQWIPQVLSCYSRVLFQLIEHSAFCLWSDLGWVPTSMESSHSTISSPFIDNLSNCGLVNI